MDFIQIAPSPTFFSILKELHTCPGAPKSISDFFNSNHKNSSTAGIPANERSNSATSKEEKQEKSDTGHDSVPSTDSPPATKPDPRKKNDKCEGSPLTTLFIRPSDLKWCHEKIRERGIPHRIHKLLNESEIILPKYEPSLRSVELEARIQRLKAQQANKEYENMTRNITLRPGKTSTASAFGQELRAMHVEINKQLITGVQYVVSIVGTFFALYFGLSFAVPDSMPRLITAIIGALVVGLAELYFIIREDIRAELSYKKMK